MRPSTVQSLQACFTKYHGSVWDHLFVMVELEFELGFELEVELDFESS